ncbi:MAG: PAS domain S-box protein [Candidatus Eremiobacterota bacterium]
MSKDNKEKTLNNLNSTEYSNERENDITLLDTLMEKENMFRHIFEHNSAALAIIEADTKISMVNEEYCKISGYKKEEVIGMNWTEQIPLGDMEKLKEYNRLRLSGNKEVPEKYEFTFYHKNGEIRHALMSVSMLEHRKIIASFIDITERKRAEEDLKAAYLKLNAIWDVSSRAYADIKTISDHILSSIVLITGSNLGFYGLMNEDESVMTIHSWSGKAMGNCSIVDKPSQFPVSSSGVWAEAIRHRKAFIMNDYASDHIAKKGLPPGHVKLTNLMVVPFFLHGKITSVASVANRQTPYNQKDAEQITSFLESINAIVERKKSEEALRASEEKLKNYTEKLEYMVRERTKELEEAREKILRHEKLSLLGKMAGTVGHEIKNPLGVISNAVYFLKITLSSGDEKTKEYLDIINSEVAKVNKIISDLKNFSRLKTVSDRKEIELSSFISNMLERHVTSGKIKINTEPVYITVDPVHMEQMLLNLITNAFDAIGDGGEVTISVFLQNNYTYLSVIDTGCGISEEKKKKIFEPLFTTKAKGMGLGLPVTKELVEVNGGTITVESTEGKGSTFTLIFPGGSKNE